MSESVTDAELAELAQALYAGLRAGGLRLASAESCTGGLIAKLITDISGSSAVFERGIVSYSNEAKQELLGVSAETLAEYGAVSAATVIAMADGLLARAPVDFTVAISGIAGPDGGTDDKPVGTVWIAWAGKGIATGASRYAFPGDRDAVRRAAAAEALIGLYGLLNNNNVAG